MGKSVRSNPLIAKQEIVFMQSETENLQQNGHLTRPVDTFDRKILAALTENARLTYAEIGERAGLSAPAVHERVRQLKRSGALAGLTARIDGASVGKPLLAFVHVDAEGWGKSERMLRLKVFPEVEEMHSVAGDTCVILKVRMASPHALEQFLAQLYVLPGVHATRSYIVLSTYLERPVQSTVTERWPETPLPTSA
jgi:Lrp/AsnC family transcriptional regulator, leucine-responsive regulatory protein